MASAEKTKKLKKLSKQEHAAHFALAPQVTETLTIINNGADDKFDLVLILQDAGGGYGMFQILPDLPQGGSATIPLKQLGLTAIEFYMRWRDVNGIGRFTSKATAGSQKFYRTMTCYWAAQVPDATIEEGLLYGDELPL